MKGIKTVTPIALAYGASTAMAGLLTSRAASLPPVTVKGNGMCSLLCPTTALALSLTALAFFAGNDRFYIRGVDYQPGGSSDPVDPLANSDTCTRDIEEWVIGRAE